MQPMAQPMAAPVGGQEMPNPNQNMKRDPAYYKAIMNANKEIKNAVKELRMARVDTTLQALRTALTNLEEYSSI